MEAHVTFRRVGMAAVVIVAVAAAGPRLTAQEKSGQFNRIIAQYEEGKVAFVNTDWAWINMEQAWDLDELRDRLAALKMDEGAPAVTPVLRVPSDGSEGFVEQGLNLGLPNIVVPKIDTAEQALSLVTAMRYPPQRGAKYPEPRGERSMGSGGAVAYWGVGQEEYKRKADVWPLNPEGELLAIVMIETKTSVDNIEEILNVPGLGAVLVGPYDLGTSLGVGPPVRGKVPEETEAAIQKVRGACMAVEKIICGIAGVDVSDRDRRVEEGWHMIQVIGGP